MNKLIALCLVVGCFFSTGCERDKEEGTYPSERIAVSSAWKSGTYRVTVIEKEGNKYIVVLTHNGIAICPATPARAEAPQ